VVVLTENIQISSDDGAGDISFKHLLNGSVASEQSLVLQAGLGHLKFANHVGSLVRLGDITIQSAKDVFSQSLFVKTLQQTSGTGHSRFEGQIDTQGDIVLTGNHFSLQGDIHTTQGGALRIDNAGVLVLGRQAMASHFNDERQQGLIDVSLLNEAVTLSLDGAFTQQGVGASFLNGVIQTTEDPVSFQSVVTLTGDVTLSTGVKAGDVVFSQRVDGGVNGQENFTIQAGEGNIRFEADVGAYCRLANVFLESAGGEFQGTIRVTSLDHQATGDLNFIKSVDSLKEIELSAGKIHFADNLTSGGGVVIRNREQFSNTVSDETWQLDGGLSQYGIGPVSLGRDIKTQGHDVLWQALVTLLSSVVIDSGALEGDVSFNNGLVATDSQSLSVSSGLGQIKFQQGIAVGNLVMSSEKELSMQGDLNVRQINYRGGLGQHVDISMVELDRILTGSVADIQAESVSNFQLATNSSQVLAPNTQQTAWPVNVFEEGSEFSQNQATEKMMAWQGMDYVMGYDGQVIFSSEVGMSSGADVAY